MKPKNTLGRRPAVFSAGESAMAQMIDALLAPLKTATDTAKGLIEVRDAVKWGEISADLYAQIYAAYQGAIAAQQQQAAMLEENRSLGERIAQLENWETEKQRYVLQQLPTGTFAYALKPEYAHGEPPHYLCANCYQVGKKRILQTSGLMLVCHDCGSQILMREASGSHRSRGNYDPFEGF